VGGYYTIQIRPVISLMTSCLVSDVSDLCDILHRITIISRLFFSIVSSCFPLSFSSLFSSN